MSKLIAGGENILVTGGCGFIGSELTKQLIDKGYKVTVADNLSKPESSVKQGYDFVEVDLTDKKATQRLFDQGFDSCINLAAKIGGIGYFHKYPAMILSENNKIYSSTFEAAANVRLPRMVYVSSSMVFESADRFPSKESDLDKIPMPISAYGFSKLIGEKYCEAFRDEHGLEFSICRPFNAYGVNEAPGEEVGYAHVIPDLVKKSFQSNGELEILGDGQQSRCYTHVSDLADGIITVMQSPEAANQDFNISSSLETKVIDLAQEIWKVCRPDLPFDPRFVPGFKYDVQRRVPDTGKMKEVLGWQAQVPLEKGLHDVIDWLRPEYSS